jgi:hypothetical protein
LSDFYQRIKRIGAGKPFYRLDASI